MLLSVSMLLLTSSYNFDDNTVHTLSLYVICVAGAESVVELSLIVQYYRIRGNLNTYL